MRILLINVPHAAIGSRIPDDHLPPLGLQDAEEEAMAVTRPPQSAGGAHQIAPRTEQIARVLMSAGPSRV